uniref:WAT1-related protein n=1 Tax=Aegilops tauschii TaxID=37682 RepID=M8BVB2_AEGTA
MASGMSPYVLITYRNLLGAVFLAPFAFFFERKTWDSISKKTLLQIFVCSVVGATMNQVFYFVGLKYSRPTVASALNNTLPAVTFALAAALKMEPVAALAGKAKKKMSNSYASPYTTTVLMASMASVQCGAIAVAAEHRLSAWALGFDIRLIGSLYAGVVASGIVIAVMSWCIQVRGPVFVSMFSPMMLIIVAVVGWGILGEKIRVGSMIGAVFIVVGLSCVLWGKGRDIVATETADADAEKKIAGTTRRRKSAAANPAMGPWPMARRSRGHAPLLIVMRQRANRSMARDLQCSHNWCHGLSLCLLGVLNKQNHMISLFHLFYESITPIHLSVRLLVLASANYSVS